MRQKGTDIQTETVEKLIVASGNVTMDVDLNRLNDAGSATEESKPLGPEPSRRARGSEPAEELVAEGLEALRFALAPDSFFTIVVTNDVLRGPLPGSMGLIPQNAANLPALLNASFHQLVLEKRQPDEAYDLVVRDSKSGFVFFNVAGHQYDYDAGTRSFSINEGSAKLPGKFV